MDSDPDCITSSKADCLRVCCKCVANALSITTATDSVVSCAEPYRLGHINLASIIKAGVKSDGIILRSKSEPYGNTCLSCHHPIGAHINVDPIPPTVDVLDAYKISGDDDLLESAFPHTKMPAVQISNSHFSATAADTPKYFIVPLPKVLGHLIQTNQLSHLLNSYITHLFEHERLISNPGSDSGQLSDVRLLINQLLLFHRRLYANPSTNRLNPTNELLTAPHAVFPISAELSCDARTKNIRLTELVLAAEELMFGCDKHNSNVSLLRYFLSRLKSSTDNDNDGNNNLCLTVWRNERVLGEGKQGTVFEVVCGEAVMALKMMKGGSDRGGRALFLGFGGGKGLPIFQVPTSGPALFELFECLSHAFAQDLVYKFNSESHDFVLQPLYETNLDNYITNIRGLPTSATLDDKLIHRFEAAYVVNQAACSLGELHGGRLVHNDLHSKNILINHSDGELDVAVIDYDHADEWFEGNSQTSSGGYSTPYLPRGAPTPAKDIRLLLRIWKQMLHPLTSQEWTLEGHILRCLEMLIEAKVFSREIEPNKLRTLLIDTGQKWMSTLPAQIAFIAALGLNETMFEKTVFKEKFNKVHVTQLPGLASGFAALVLALKIAEKMPTTSYAFIRVVVDSVPMEAREILTNVLLSPQYMDVSLD